MIIQSKYFLRNLQFNDIRQVELCLKSVNTSIINKELFVSPTPEYVQKIISGYGKSAGIFSDEGLVGFASIASPKKGKNNLGHYLKYNIELTSVVQLEHICILPEHRGKGLAPMLVRFLLGNVDPNYKFLLSTVSPYNLSSLSVAFKVSQMIISYIHIYNFDRYLMFRDLTKNLCITKVPEFEINISDIKSVKYLLDNGYYGLNFGKEKTTLNFAKW